MRIQRHNPRTGNWREIANISKRRSFLVDSNTLIVEGNSQHPATGELISYRITFTVGELQKIIDVLAQKGETQ